MSIRSLLEHVGIDPGDVIFVNGQPLNEGDPQPAYLIPPAKPPVRLRLVEPIDGPENDCS